MSRKYCFFTANYLPKLGGVEIYTKCLAKALVKRGDAVTVITCGEEKKVEKVMEEGIRLIKLPSFQTCNGRLPLINYNGHFHSFHKYIMKCQFDLVIVQTRYYPLSLFGAKYAAKKRIPCILLDHSTAHLDFGKGIVNKGFELYEHIMTSVIKRSQCSFMGVSQACNEWLLHFGITAEGVLYNSVEESVCKMEPQNIYEQYNIPNKAQIILFAGRLLKEKGIEKLVEAVSKLEDKYPDLYLVVAGDGELYEKLSKAKNSHCIYLGRLKHEEVLKLMKEAMIFCLPTDYPEGFPTSVLEAAICKCYIITTTAGGSKELITSLEYGTIIPKGQSTDALKSSIDKVLGDPKMRLGAVEKSYNKVLDRFTWDDRAREVEEITKAKKGI